MKKILIVILVLSWHLSFAGDVFPFNNPQKQQQFQQLTSQLRCMVCQNETLADSQAPLANDLRRQIYTMVKRGETDNQITTYLVNRYGDFVLYNPPVQKNTYLLWFAPAILILFGFLILFFVIKRYRIKGKS